MDIITTAIEPILLSWLTFKATPCEAAEFIGYLDAHLILDLDGDMPINVHTGEACNFSLTVQGLAYRHAKNCLGHGEIDPLSMRRTTRREAADHVAKTRSRRHITATMMSRSMPKSKAHGMIYKGCPCCTGLTYKRHEGVLLGDDDFVAEYEHDMYELEEIYYSLKADMAAGLR